MKKVPFPWKVFFTSLKFSFIRKRFFPDESGDFRPILMVPRTEFFIFTAHEFSRFFVTDCYGTMNFGILRFRTPKFWFLCIRSLRNRKLRTDNRWHRVRQWYWCMSLQWCKYCKGIIVISILTQKHQDVY